MSGCGALSGCKHIILSSCHVDVIVFPQDPGVDVHLNPIVPKDGIRNVVRGQVHHASVRSIFGSKRLGSFPVTASMEPATSSASL